VLETALAAQRLYAYTNRSARERAVRANAIGVLAVLRDLTAAAHQALMGARS
jgi:hypothetical protein